MDHGPYWFKLEGQIIKAGLNGVLENESCHVKVKLQSLKNFSKHYLETILIVLSFGFSILMWQNVSLYLILCDFYNLLVSKKKMMAELHQELGRQNFTLVASEIFTTDPKSEMRALKVSNVFFGVFFYSAVFIKNTWPFSLLIRVSRSFLGKRCSYNSRYVQRR